MPNEAGIAVFLLILVGMPFLVYWLIKTISNFLNLTESIYLKDSGVAKKRIINSLHGYIFTRLMFLLTTLIIFASTYKQAKPIAVFALVVFIIMLKDNYKIYADLVMKDGISFSGTVVKTQTQSVFSAWGKKYMFENFEYLLDIETDDGEYIKCASRTIALLASDRIENAYLTKRTKLLIYCDKPLINFHNP